MPAILLQFDFSFLAQTLCVEPEKFLAVNIGSKPVQFPPTGGFSGVPCPYFLLHALSV